MANTKMRKVLSKAEKVLKNPDLAKDFFKSPSKGKKYFTLDKKTLKQWDKEYNLSKLIVDNSSNLYVQTRFGENSYSVRLNLNPGMGKPKIIQGFIKQFNPENMGIGFLPRFYNGKIRPDLPMENPFLEYKFFVFDDLGRQVLDIIQGTGSFTKNNFSAFQSIEKEAVFSPYRPLDISCWFDVRKLKGDKTGLEISFEDYESLMLSVSLHKPEEIKKLTIPENSKTKHFFDVAYEYMKK